ncbi:MFS transporter [Roseobacter sinensis]|uniref:MFS transporter n=1 Tax=Roseobacter sinensis TaxID=2931391 RepID=A0ABT3BJW1_9RHOB|nr:MFS transporter [Roseobacter sp. WL0113]MCV3273866.1 MFS transporter [Roseobacter sp. WL0113]
MIPAALKSEDLQKLLLAQLPADFADWLDFVAIGTLLAFVWDAPNYAYAFLAVGMGAPYLIIGPFAGALVDRLSVRSVLIWSNVGRALATGALLFAADWVVLVFLVAVRSSVDSFFGPAKQAAIQALTTSENRTSANGLSHGINQASKIVAPSAGGTFLIWFAPSIIFVINAAISLSAALLCARLKEVERSERSTKVGENGLWSDVQDGLTYVRSQATVRTVLLMMAAMYFAMFIYDTFIAPLTQSLGFEQQHLGYALAAVGAGGVIGSIVFSILPELRQPQRWIAIGTFSGGAMLLVLGISDLLAASRGIQFFILIFLTLGLTTAMTMVPIRIVLQNTVPPDRMGSVTALSEAANTMALLTAPFAGAVLVTLFSVRAPFTVGGCILVIAGLLISRLNLGRPKS